MIALAAIIALFTSILGTNLISNNSTTTIFGYFEYAVIIFVVVVIYNYVRTKVSK